MKLHPSTHPVFRGHFPGNPILPGFTHLEIVSAVLKHEIKVIKKAKFIQMAYPGETITYATEWRGDQEISVKASAGERKISEFTYAF